MNNNNLFLDIKSLLLLALYCTIHFTIPLIEGNVVNQSFQFVHAKVDL